MKLSRALGLSLFAGALTFWVSAQLFFPRDANGAVCYLRCTGGNVSGNVTISNPQGATLKADFVDAGVVLSKKFCLSFDCANRLQVPAGYAWELYAGSAGNILIGVSNGTNQMLGALDMYGATTNGRLNFQSTGHIWISGVTTGSLPTCNSGLKGAIHFDTTVSKHAFCNGTAWEYVNASISAGTSVLSSVYVNAVTAATTTYGGGTLPAQAFTASAIRFRIRTAGSGGSTNATWRISDGTNICDCTFACNLAAASTRAACAGSAGTGCAWAASAVLSYSMNGIGDCTTGPDLIGNVDIEGAWQ